jgi:hypothetical protein
MKNTAVICQEAHPICLLVAAYLTCGNIFTLQVLCHYYIVFKYEVPVILEAKAFFRTEVDSKIYPAGYRLGIAGIIAFGTTLNTGECKSECRTGPQASQKCLSFHSPDYIGVVPG